MCDKQKPKKKPNSQIASKIKWITTQHISRNVQTTLNVSLKIEMWNGLSSRTAETGKCFPFSETSFSKCIFAIPFASHILHHISTLVMDYEGGTFSRKRKPNRKIGPRIQQASNWIFEMKTLNKFKPNKIVNAQTFRLCSNIQIHYANFYQNFYLYRLFCWGFALHLVLYNDFNLYFLSLHRKWS